jgi:isochorismate synthase
MTTPEPGVTRATQSLRRILSERRGIPAKGGEIALASTTIAVEAMDPLLVFRQARGQERVFWERAMEDFALVAIGATAELTGDGTTRCTQLAQARRRLGKRAVVEAPDDYPLSAPVCLGGLAFDAGRRRDPDWADYPDALLLIPQLLFTWSRGSCWLTINALAAPASATETLVDETAAVLSKVLAGDDIAVTSYVRRDRGGLRAQPHCETVSTMTGGTTLSGRASPAEDAGEARLWKEAVSAIVEDIRRGTVQKQVLARRVRLGVPGPTDPVPLLQKLREGYGLSCTVFAMTRGNTCFLGASPERLVRVDGRAVKADGLAGSTARGSTAEEDRSMGLALLASSKERHEHALVVDALRDALEPVCAKLCVPEEPMLLRMPNVQHLHTPVEAVLRSGTNILDLVERLHPTPTVGGVPREGILPRIRRYEPFDRGWYAGPVGWIDANDGGEFAVGIRSALVKGIGTVDATATRTAINLESAPESAVLLYAGCGIVAGSDPEAEHRESCLKLRPLLSAMEGPSCSSERSGPSIEHLACSEA